MKASTVAAASPIRVAIDLDKLKANALQAAILLKAIANPHRLIILCQLAEGEKSVGELGSVLHLSQSALSQHLMVLRRERIVAARRVAQSVFYALASEDAQAIMLTLYDVFCGKAAKKRSPKPRAMVR